MGPVIDNAAADGLLRAQAELVAGQARPLRLLQRVDPARPLLRPALLDVTDASVRPDEERFGPLLQVRRVEGFAEALAAASDTRFGLAAGLIGGDEALYRRFWRGVRAGIVNWNRPTTGASSAAPFGGIGASGNHRPSAFYAADYCAFPVAGLETSGASFRVETGLATAQAIS
jgi:succinylglutamic semialdehyde dehydrogenase